MAQSKGNLNCGCHRHFWALLTSRWVKTRDNKPSRGCRVWCGGYHCNWQFAIAQVEIYFDGECDNVGPFICTAFGPEVYSWAFLLLAFLARAGIDWRIGLVDDIAGCRTLKHCSASQLPASHHFSSLLDTVMRKFKVHSTAYATCGQRRTDSGRRTSVWLWLWLSSSDSLLSCLLAVLSTRCQCASVWLITKAPARHWNCSKVDCGEGCYRSWASPGR